PRTLEGRVLAGQSVLIPFDGYGMDPDGDTVTLAGIDGQPQSGVATISPDGASILYTSVSGYRGQVSFTYEVTDEFGAVGKGTVRVGVLD
ncbi:Ig-like domain-containing protein, partial [Acinetobacter baumannii]